MKMVRTEIVIDASAQTIWSILDDLELYVDWNRVLPEVRGLTRVGGHIDAVIIFTGSEPQPFSPKLIRIVGARELRWVSEIPGESVSRAEHYFILTPLPDGKTHVEHCEEFDGPFADAMWAMVGHIAPADYAALNEALKARAEAAERKPIAIHPAIDGADFGAATEPVRHLRCKCARDPVKLEVNAPIKHNHLCGCSQCWKPDGALFALIAIAPRDAVRVVAGEEKLHVVTPENTIQRHACRDCGVHMIGKVNDPDHHFFGLAFVHPELSSAAPGKPEFAGFVSSIIEAGASPTQMHAVRKTLNAHGIAAYDAFSPELMDLIAWHKVKMRKHTAR